jgi:catechol 2,3-dioxygenase-like lactoylglutathione lyase family enzyme
MIEHVSIPVSDMKRSVDFYSKAAAPLGYLLYRDFAPDAVGYLEGESTSLWLARKNEKITPMHVALRGESKEAVQKFYEEGLKAGGTDNGAPGFRTDYGDDYYAAFLLDPDGNNIEACYFGAKASDEA